MTKNQDRPLGSEQQVDSALDVFLHRHWRCICRVRFKGRQVVGFHKGALQIVRNVDQDRSGPAASCNMHRLLEFVTDPPRITKLNTILCNWSDHRNNFSLLKSELPHSRFPLQPERGHLSSEVEHRYGIEPGARNTRNHVGGAGTAGADGAAEVTGSARVTVGRHCACLFMVWTDWLSSGAIVQRMQNVNRRPARYDEDMPDALGGKKIRDVI
jgi:hypothetical protein